MASKKKNDSMGCDDDDRHQICPFRSVKSYDVSSSFCTERRIADGERWLYSSNRCSKIILLYPVRRRIYSHQNRKGFGKGGRVFDLVPDPSRYIYMYKEVTVLTQGSYLSHTTLKRLFVPSAFCSVTDFDIYDIFQMNSDTVHRHSSILSLIKRFC